MLFLRVDALLKARSFLSVARTVPGPDHLGLLCRWLATSLRLPPPTNSPALDSNLSRTPSSAALRRPTALHRTRTSPGLRTNWPLVLSTPTPARLHSTPGLAFQRALLWGTGVRLVFYLRPFTSRWLRPFCHFDPISPSTRTTRTWWKSSALAPTMESPRLSAEMLFVGIRRCWRKDGGTMEMMVRRCCLLWRRW